MAEVGITLKLSASEFQTLRRELAALKESLKEQRYDPDGNRVASPLFHELQKREAEVTFLVEKLG